MPRPAGCDSIWVDLPRSAPCRSVRRTTLAAVRGVPRGLGRRVGFVVVAAVGLAALVAAGVDGTTGAHAGAPGISAGPDVQGAAIIPAQGIPITRHPLKGTIIGIDPGHNGRNYTDPSYLDRQVWNGREWED